MRVVTWCELDGTCRVWGLRGMEMELVGFVDPLPRYQDYYRDSHIIKQIAMTNDGRSAEIKFKFLYSAT